VTSREGEESDNGDSNLRHSYLNRKVDLSNEKAIKRPEVRKTESGGKTGESEVRKSKGEGSGWRVKDFSSARR